MLNFGCFWPKPLLGLDIQAEEIRLLQLPGFYKKKIKKAVTCHLPQGAVMDGKIVETEIVTACLRELVQEHQFAGFNVAIALPVESVVIQSISVAKQLDESELEAEIISHLRHCLPDVAAGLCYDYLVSSSQDAMQNDMLLIATSFTNLNRPITVVQDAGLTVRVVDVDQYALARANQSIKKNGLNIEEKWLMSFGLALRGGYVWQR